MDATYTIHNNGIRTLVMGGSTIAPGESATFPIQSEGHTSFYVSYQWIPHMGREKNPEWVEWDSAVHAAAPVSPVSEAEDRVVALAAKIEALRIDRNQQSKIRNDQRDKIATLEAENTRLNDALKVRTDERDALELLSASQDRALSGQLRLVDVLADERDAALAFLRKRTLAAQATDGEYQALESHADAQKELLALSRATIAARDARIAELDTLLAQRPAPVPDTPRPAHDWMCVTEGDRRRMGG